MCSNDSDYKVCDNCQLVYLRWDLEVRMCPDCFYLTYRLVVTKLGRYEWIPIDAGSDD